MGRPFRVAVVIETFAEYGRSLFRGIASYIQRGCNWQLYTTPVKQIDLAVLREAIHADGLITWLYSHQLTQILNEANIPVVAVHYRGDLPIPTVDNDNPRIIEMAANHLIAQGFRQFAYFGPAGREYSMIRSELFRKSIERRGFNCSVFQTARTDPHTFGWHTPDESVVQWLRSLPKPTGILASNDVMGQQLLQHASHAGVRVPDDAAVVGVDNDELVCLVTSPPMSSIDTAGERVGFEAARMMDRLLKGQPLESNRVFIEPGQLVVRQSSDVLAVGDPLVADAIRFVRENIARNLSVEDVMREIPVARRTLERAFQKSIGRSIHDEIIDSRIRRAKKLLIETNMPIPDISAACGFSNRTHLDAVFRRHAGHAPGAYRRTFRSPR